MLSRTILAQYLLTHPFNCCADERSLAYIEALDAQRDLSILAQHGLGIRPECARILRVLTALLKKAARRGLTPYDIGSIMCRWAVCSCAALISGRVTPHIPVHVMSRPWACQMSGCALKENNGHPLPTLHRRVVWRIPSSGVQVAVRAAAFQDQVANLIQLQMLH